MTKIFIKSIPRETATKISEFRNDHGAGATGKKLNKTKQGNCKDTLVALYSPKIGGLATGLNEYIDNPYKGAKDLPTEFKEIAKEDKMLRQHVLEIKHGREKDFYVNKAWMKGDSLRSEDLTFYQKFKFKLNDGSTMLDLAIPEQECAYYIALATKFVANSEQERLGHVWPKATHVITIENEDEELKFKKKQSIDKAKAFLTSDDMTPSMLRNFCKLLKLAKDDNLREEAAYNLLSDYIDKSKVGDMVELRRFESLHSLTKTAAGRKELEAKILLTDLLNHWIVSEKQGTYTWNQKNAVIGERESEAITYLLNPNKQAETDELKKQLKLKKGEH